MRWEKISSSASNEVYDLWHNEKKLLTLTLHLFSNTARVESADHKRVFLIRKEGFFRNKTVLRNEYGIKIGELGLENETSFIDVNDERFYYHLNNQPVGELVLYKDSKEQPLVICQMDPTDGNAFVRVQKDKKFISQSGLLLALCWYLFLPVRIEQMAEGIPA